MRFGVVCVVSVKKLKKSHSLSGLGAKPIFYINIATAELIEVTLKAILLRKRVLKAN